MYTIVKVNIYAERSEPGTRGLVSGLLIPWANNSCLLSPILITTCQGRLEVPDFDLMAILDEFESNNKKDVAKPEQNENVTGTTWYKE